MSERDIVQELGIKISLKDFRKPSDKTQFYNPKLANIRLAMLILPV